MTEFDFLLNDFGNYGNFTDDNSGNYKNFTDDAINTPSYSTNIDYFILTILCLLVTAALLVFVYSIFFKNPDLFGFSEPIIPSNSDIAELQENRLLTSPITRVGSLNSLDNEIVTSSV